MTHAGRADGFAWRQVTVIGCGLIGASFALALRRADARVRVLGWDASPAALDEAARRGAIDGVDDEFGARSDLIYLATPVAEIIRFLRERGPRLPPGATVTDAGSTKVDICRAARENVPSACAFVGGHPVAGSHQAGPAHARADLFENAPYVLTPGGGPNDQLNKLEATITSIGARPRRMSATEHDRALALVSHLPQLVSSALAATVGDRAEEEAAVLRDLCGTGYRDTTRLAASSWAVWRDILATNRGHVAAALDEYLARLTRVRDELRGGESLDVTGEMFEGVPGEKFDRSQRV